MALSEPEWQEEPVRTAQSAEFAAQYIARDVMNLRSAILNKLEILDRRNIDGSPVTNYFSDAEHPGHRKLAYNLIPIVRAGLSQRFLLCIKHNALYTGILPELIASGSWKIICIIRNPVDVLSSWRTLDVPVSRGRLPAGETHWQDLREVVMAASPLVEKQILICELFFKRYRDFSNRVTILRYEEIVDSVSPLLVAVDRNGEQPIDLIKKPRNPWPTYARDEIVTTLRNLFWKQRIPTIAEYYGAAIAGSK